MTLRWRTVVPITVSILLTLAASFAEMVFLAAGITVGDMEGSPPSQTQAGRLAMRDLDHRANLALILAIAALLPACILLGGALARSLEESFPRAGRSLAYCLGLLLCPAASVVVVIAFVILTGHSG